MQLSPCEMMLAIPMAGFAIALFCLFFGRMIIRSFKAGTKALNSLLQKIPTRGSIMIPRWVLPSTAVVTTIVIGFFIVSAITIVPCSKSSNSTAHANEQVGPQVASLESSIEPSCGCDK